MVVKVLVYADDEDEAVDLAGDILDGMCGEAYFPFDYYNTFDNGWATERWGELPKAVKICGEFGTAKCDTCAERFKCFTTEMNTMLEEAMLSTKKEFFEHLGEIKKYLTTHNDDELFEDDWFKYHCHSAGEGQGPNVWLYDQDGEGITETKHLMNVLNRWACNNKGEPDPEYDKPIYLVPADVHY